MPEHAQIIGGHTQISSGVIAPMYSVTGIGRATKEQCRQDERLRPEYDLVVTGWMRSGRYGGAGAAV